MKQALALAILGVVALMLQGAATLAVPAQYVPDLGLLLVVALALHLRSTATGVVLTGLIGYVTDLLSGSLLGQQTLLRMGAYAAARISSARLNLRGPLPQALFVALLSIGYAVGLWVLVAFVAPEARAPLVGLGRLLSHALVNALVAPLLSALVAALLGRLGDDEGSQRLLPLEPRKFST